MQFTANEEGYYDFVQNRYIYTYKDHLGNLRLSYYKQTDGTAKVLEENHYYPFGLRHTGYTPVLSNNTYRYKYNGKEVQENGMYDYEARMYMPEIARWGVIDPMAEIYRAWSPYNYAVNNPVSFIDPDGRLTYDWQLGAYRDGKGELMGWSMNNWGDSSFGKGSTNDTVDRSAEIINFISSALGTGAGLADGELSPWMSNYIDKSNDANSKLGLKDIIILNASDGAGGRGHSGLIIGNDKEGYTYIASDGRVNSSGSAWMGGKNDTTVKTFRTKREAMDFAKTQYNYDDSITIKTNSKQDLKAATRAMQQLQSNYHFLFNNCNHIISAALVGAGLSKYGGYSVIPNVNFEELKNNFKKK
ncbi:RHS repeat-associated core domain-containing protein [Chryseobacterium scophthalmum]|uniref:RHS repeat-associated core domain-containing protein n=1 Tax=Chryseobacterium scophthalmum TaxID=59733 RepID=UPI00398B5F55